MDLLTSKRAWLTGPIVFLLGLAAVFACWLGMTPERLMPLFDNEGMAPVELMTLPLFALIVPLVWLASPFGGSWARRAFWNLDASLLAVMAIVRETDLHKMLFASIWPDVAATFRGTVFKMRFLKAAGEPLAAKLFVAAFFALFFLVTVGTLAYFFLRLVRGFFKLHPVCWTWAAFGVCSVMVLVVDRLPANLRHMGVSLAALDGEHGTLAALFTALEEGGEAVMALLALLALLQAFVRRRLDPPSR